jgi:hypothetical protein
MKRPSLVFLILAVTLLAAPHAFGFRCGTQLVNIGDKIFEVSSKCGEPVSKETVGYTLKNDRRELEIKEWIYGPWNGVYYYLTFHGTDLIDIEQRRDPR